jgi:hypothetical protein
MEHYDDHEAYLKKLYEDYKKELQNLIGQPCYGYVDLLMPESVMLMFGGELKDPETYSITIGCIWQITRAGKSVCAYTGGHNHDGQMESHLNRLKSEKVAALHLKEPDMKLYVLFESGLKLSVFPNRHSKNNFVFTFKRVTYLDKFGRPPDSIDGGGFGILENLQASCFNMPSGTE